MRPGGDPPPTREAPDSVVGARFAKLARRDTGPEMRLRRMLHERGLRYRVDYPVAGLPRRRVDIAFTRARLAVMVDGCFWHHCPVHGVVPTTNQEWWEWKFRANRDRDADTDARLAALGWVSLRVWEHEPTAEAADRVEEAVRTRLA